MKYFLPFLFVFLAACSTDGTTTTPVNGAVAKEVGGDQGAAQATESGSSVNKVYNLNMPIFGASKVTVTPSEEGPEVAVEGSPNAEVKVQGATFGGTDIGSGAINSTNSSGGGAAGGGAGATSREGSK